MQPHLSDVSGPPKCKNKGCDVRGGAGLDYRPIHSSSQINYPVNAFYLRHARSHLVPVHSALKKGDAPTLSLVATKGGSSALRRLRPADHKDRATKATGTTNCKHAKATCERRCKPKTMQKSEPKDTHRTRPQQHSSSTSPRTMCCQHTTCMSSQHHATATLAPGTTHQFHVPPFPPFVTLCQFWQFKDLILPNFLPPSLLR